MSNHKQIWKEITPEIRKSGEKSGNQVEISENSRNQQKSHGNPKINMISKSRIPNVACRTPRIGIHSLVPRPFCLHANIDTRIFSKSGKIW